MAKVPAFFSKLGKNLETAVLASEIAMMEVNNVIKLPDPALNGHRLYSFRPCYGPRRR